MNGRYAYRRGERRRAPVISHLSKLISLYSYAFGLLKKSFLFFKDNFLPWVMDSFHYFKKYTERTQLHSSYPSLSKLEYLFSNQKYTPNVDSQGVTFFQTLFLFPHAIHHQDHEFLEKIQLCLRYGADPNLPLPEHYGAPSILHYLIKHNSKLLRPLFTACLQENVLLDFSIRDKERCTPLILACKHRETRIIQYIISYHERERRRVDVNHYDIQGMTPLHYAALLGQVSTFFLLFKKGARLTLKNILGETPMDLLGSSDERTRICLASSNLLPQRDDHAHSNYFQDRRGLPLLKEDSNGQIMAYALPNNEFNKERLLHDMPTLLNAKNWFFYNQKKTISQQERAELHAQINKFKGASIFNCSIHGKGIILNEVNCVLNGYSVSNTLRFSTHTPSSFQENSVIRANKKKVCFKAF